MKENLESLNVFFVQGVAHSGTTIIYRLLGRHPDLAWFSQFSQRSGTVPGRIKIPLWGYLNRIGRNLFTIPWRKQRGWDEYFIPRPMEANKIWEFLLPDKKPSIPDPSSMPPDRKLNSNKKQRFKRVFRSELKAWNRSKMICKLPRLLQETRILSQLLPKSKFIHVIRDGRAVALSNLKKFKRHFPEEKALERSAAHWKRNVEWMEFEVKKQIKSSRYHTFKLEYFQKNPREKIQEIIQFLNLSWDRYFFSLPDIKTDTNSKYKRKASGKQKEKLNNLLGSTLRRLSYDQSW